MCLGVCCDAAVPATAAAAVRVGGRGQWRVPDNNASASAVAGAGAGAVAAMAAAAAVAVASAERGGGEQQRGFPPQGDAGPSAPTHRFHLFLLPPPSLPPGPPALERQRDREAPACLLHQPAAAEDTRRRERAERVS